VTLGWRASIRLNAVLIHILYMKTTQFTIWLRTAMLAAGLLLGQLSWAQAPAATATFAFSYEFQSAEGTNASAVTYIPQLKLYVTCIAGNADYPMEVFDANGKTITSIPCGMDLRGLWYNPGTRCLETNGYGDQGWFSMQIGGNGVPTGEWSNIRTGQKQPNEQSVLSYVCPPFKNWSR
jgi:hypothetical protein